MIGTIEKKDARLAVAFNKPEAFTERQPTTIVIQLIFEKGMLQPVYRLIAYRPKCLFSPVEFPSLDALLQEFDSISQGFHPESVVRDDIQHTYILFCGMLMLSDDELGHVGLFRKP